MSKYTPENIAKLFFHSLSQLQFPTCWNLFTSKTQKEFLDWTLQKIYQQHNNAASEAKLGAPEVKFMFEVNDRSLGQIFWKRFIGKSMAQQFLNYAYFDLKEIQGKKATVIARFEFPDGRKANKEITMINERGGWKFAYLESGFPFF